LVRDSSNNLVAASEWVEKIDLEKTATTLFNQASNLNGVLELMLSEERSDSSLDIDSCEKSCWKASVNSTVLLAGVKDGN